MDRAGDTRRIGGKRWPACVRAGLASAAVTFAAAATGVDAQDITTAQTAAERFPTSDRRAQIAPTAEFDQLRAIAHGGGHVRVIIGLRIAFTPEGALSPGAREAQHRAIASASAAVQRALSE